MSARRTPPAAPTIEPLSVRPIGVVRSPFTEKREAPRQSAAARDVAGTIELFATPGMEHAIEDVASCTHLWIVFWFHEAHDFRPKVLPPRSAGQRRGVLATRSPHRPNPIGLSVVRLDRVEGLVLHVRDVDMLDGTPVLDIKPYLPYADSVPGARVGWLTPLVEPEAEGRGPGVEGQEGLDLKEIVRAPDPERGFDVTFGPRAEEALGVLRDEFGIDLAPSIAGALALGPQPHPYRRIRKTEGGLVLAVKDWRARFVAEGRRIVVTAIETGYRPKELYGEGGDADSLRPHRAVAERFGAR